MSAKSKTKAEKEKLKKEEEERKAREEEEERLRLMEEEKERKRREKQEAAERQKRERELAVLRNEEHSELRVKLASVRNELSKYYSNLVQQQEWQRYVRCDGTPDPTIAAQINTYINLNREADTCVEMGVALTKNQLSLSLIEELFYKIRQIMPSGGSGHKLRIQQFHNTILELQQLVADYIDNATLTLLEKAVYLADKDSGNLEAVSKNDHVTVALWANLAKNAKIKAYMFDEEGLGFEIPRSMATSDISIRFVLTKYDHHSYRATSSASMRTRARMPELPKSEVAEETQPTQKEADEENNSRPETTEEAPQDPLMALLGGGTAGTNATADEDGEGAAEDKEAPQADREAETDTKHTSSKEDTANKQGVVEGVADDEEEEEAVPVDPHAGDDTVINLHQWAPIYGVLYIDLLSVPPQPITTCGWTIKQVVGKKLQRMDLKEFTEVDAAQQPQDASVPPVTAHQTSSPPEGASTAGVGGTSDSQAGMGGTSESQVGGAGNASEADMGAASQVGGAGNESATAGSVSQSALGAGKSTANVLAATKESVKILFKLPSSVCIPEMEIQVGRWNEDKKCWKIDGISDVQYDKEQNLLSWRSTVLGAFCCFQDCYVNMPLQQWEMRPKDTNNVLITIISTVAEIELEIKEDKCRLNFHEDKEQMVKELRALCGEWMEPLQVVDRLTAIGINVFPEKFSHDYVSICEKDLLTEQFVYQQMALVASGLSFAWSRFNAEEILTRDQIVIQAHDELQAPGDAGEEEWSLLLLGREKMYKLAVDEFAETFSVDMAPESQVHFDMPHLVKDWLSEASLQRIEDSSPIFIDTVFQMLNATKLITFS